MSTEIGVGVSTKLDSFIAGREAARIAFYQIHRQEPDSLIIFISTIYNQGQVIRGIRSVIKDTPLIGCSSAGTITSFGSLRSSVSVCAILSDSLRFYYGKGTGVSKNPRVAGNSATKEAARLRGTRKQVYIMFSDGLSGNNADVLRGAQEILGTSFPIIGGSATDNLRFQIAYQYLGNSMLRDSAVGLLLTGDIDIGIGTSHGWQPIGQPHQITKARSNVIREIDRKKAINLYEEYLGKTSRELKKEGIANLGASYPLGIPLKEKNEYLARSPVGMDDNGNLILTAEIPEQEDVNLMIGDKDLVLEATRKACIEALKNTRKSRIRFAFIFSDIARLKLLRKDSQSEVNIIKEVLGENIPLFGCYTGSEYAPIYMEGYSGQTCLHNQAVSIAVFSE